MRNRNPPLFSLETFHLIALQNLFIIHLFIIIIVFYLFYFFYFIFFC